MHSYKMESITFTLIYYVCFEVQISHRMTVVRQNMKAVNKVH